MRVRAHPPPMPSRPDAKPATVPVATSTASLLRSGRHNGFSAPSTSGVADVASGVVGDTEVPVALVPSGPVPA